jgi:hypothetical protein
LPLALAPSQPRWEERHELAQTHSGFRVCLSPTTLSTPSFCCSQMLFWAALWGLSKFYAGLSFLGKARGSKDSPC